MSDGPETSNALGAGSPIPPREHSHPAFGFLFQRLSHGLLVMLGVVLVVFVATRLVGNPVDVMLPLDATDAERTQFASLYGFNDPILTQLAGYARDLVRLDFGDSLWQGTPAMPIVLSSLPRTLLLVAAGLALALIAGATFGIASGTRAGTRTDGILSSISLTFLSLPQFWVGLMLMLLFSVQLGLLPTSGFGTWRHAVLPVVTLALPAAGRIAMLTRATTTSLVTSPHVTAARTRGLSRQTILLSHIVRNCRIAILTIASWEFMAAFAGYVVLVESVFAWPGIGQLTIQAVRRQDLFLVQAVVFVVAGLIVLTNIASDALLRRLDPRIAIS